MANSSLRIHPAIGMARVGNSTEYYLGPETMAASPQEGQALTGGLPIKPGTENTTITSGDLRDAQGRLKRQAARFKIFQYPNEDSKLSYPTQGGEEVLIGSTVDGKKVKDIIWTAHLANKKANCWEIDEDANLGIELYKPHEVTVNGKTMTVSTPPLRNPDFDSSSPQNPYTVNPANTDRLKKLVIDAGPRAIKASQGTTPVKFDNTTQASYYDQSLGAITNQANYPIQFPATNGSSSNGSDPISYLGEIITEPNGRLLVLGGHGLACAFDNQGNFDASQPLCKDVDNNNWLDDTSDGPVTAVLVFEDGTQQAIEGSAWAVVTDPAYAPQTLNVVNLWDDVYNTWLENFNLQPEVFSNGKYNPEYKPYFQDDIFPTLNSAHMQMWNTNLPDQAISAHERVKLLTEQKPPFDMMKFIRNPDGSQNNNGAPLMPLSLGDANQAFLTVSRQQYFFMEQWNKGLSVGASPLPIGEGEQLDKTILVNCLGGRFSPGIDLTFIVRDPDLYNKDWQNPAIGPFRINAEELNYASATKDQPFLGVGYTPLRPDPVQPGDLCKFMAIPWHTDYNSCATHTPAPNPGGDITEKNVYSGTVNTTLFWSWPAQRPVAVYTFNDLSANNGDIKSTKQRFSVRGEGTAAQENLSTPGCPASSGFDTAAMNVGRYQNRRNILTEWVKIGTIMQGPAIDGYPDGFNKDYYLEVESLFDKDESNLVVFWPNVVDDEVYPPKN
ncbi:LodA/GoxA family CTQ-dependent oxidase [Roseivirga seohaensis]|uniref:LodA/GoxA family CTQ-dependent oxidase n=1 Tax=Roseivirga seohaensis TaxID=1914963 RepID=UPI003BA89578